MRVLHAVEPFLNISENWIYPQIAGVPNVEATVVCGTVTNLESFPIASEALVVRQILGAHTSSLLAKVVRSIASRSGYTTLRTFMRLRRRRPQLLHAHFGPQGWQCLRLARQLHIPLVTSFYGYDAWRLPCVERAWESRCRALFRAGELFLVEGPAMRNRLIELGCPPQKVRVHRIGVDVCRLRYVERNLSGALSIVMVGRFVEKKGLTDGLKACALAATQGVDLRITIIGDSSANDCAGQRIKAELKKLACQTALKDRVVFAGYRSLAETREIIATHHVFLCPSRHAQDGDAEGGSPVVLTEAMAQGLICVGSRHCDIPEVILHEKTGLLCPEQDFEAMARALMEISKNFAGLSRFSKAGRQHIEEGFSLVHQMHGLGSFYADLVAQTGHKSAAG